MKVAVITRHAISNYGSLLQAIATQMIINDLGCDCVIIDYVREDEKYSTVEKTLLKNKGKWSKNKLKRALYLLIRQPESIWVGKKFQMMREAYLNLSSRYSSNSMLCMNTPSADIYMTGSDQVWGPVANGEYDGTYFLDFVADKRKISYAASFGKASFDCDTMKLLKRWLESYSDVSVRENVAVQLVESMGYHAKQVLDPTLLIDKYSWMKFIKKRIKKKYILIYQLHNDKKLNEYAKKISKKMSLPMIRVTAYPHQIIRPGRTAVTPCISQFLAYIMDATIMITDSFHGTAFAINFNTQFIEVLPNNSTGSRNQSILKLTGLEDRIVTDFNDLTVVEKKIDYSHVNKILMEEKEKSLNILKSFLKL